MNCENEGFDSRFIETAKFSNVGQTKKDSVVLVSP